MSNDSIEKYKEIRKNILLRCVDDYTGLWQIIRAVEEAFPSISFQDCQKCSLKIIQALLEERLIQPGQYEGPKWTPWISSIQESLNRIRQEWEKFDGEPGIDDIVIFNVTSLGEKKLKDMD